MRDTIQLLLDTVGDDLYCFCCRLTRNRMDADDLYQEVFLKALEQEHRLLPVSNREQAEEIRKNRNFLMGIATNLWRNQWRKKKKEQKNLSLEDTEFFEIPISDGEDMQANLEHKEIQQKLTEHIRSLPEKLKTVVYLFYAAEMQIIEIADTMHISRGTVKSRLYLASMKVIRYLYTGGGENVDKMLEQLPEGQTLLFLGVDFRLGDKDFDGNSGMSIMSKFDENYLYGQFEKVLNLEELSGVRVAGKYIDLTEISYETIQ